MFKEYKRNGSVIDVTLENDKVVKISSKFIDNMMTNLEIDEEEAVLTWLEDEEYIINEDQAELNDKAKENKVTKVIKAKNETAKKTQKERVRKENPVKEGIIAGLAEYLTGREGVAAVKVENVGKLITFEVDGRQFKLDLVEKRQPKEK